MSNTEPNSSPNDSASTKKSKAVLRLEALQEKMAALTRQGLEAEAAVQAEKRVAAIRRGLNDFVDLLGLKEPDEIEGIVSMAMPPEAPIEKVESVRHWIESLKVAAMARRGA